SRITTVPPPSCSTGAQGSEWLCMAARVRHSARQCIPASHSISMRKGVEGGE
ncbi:unnamed protein product, partial [Closterium sp. Yama58-4]